jgi:hypothetical protein
MRLEGGQTKLAQVVSPRPMTSKPAPMIRSGRNGHSAPAPGPALTRSRPVMKPPLEAALSMIHFSLSGND